ncbi:SARP family transcriptional regulator [Kitasatospora sp. NE20-6]|uniref:AfsR/SARP family transcriptional regulator n=1 Tax=Kitasatospora sp. NE20-6 TaxID=2859066 RepID=UPI0034DC9A2D
MEAQVLLLGPVLLHDRHGRTLDVGGPKRRAVLAALAIHANESVAVGRLLDLVWDCAPPPQARAALQGHIAALRKILPEGLAITTLSGGYRLTCDPGMLDCARFDRLRRAADAAGDDADRSALLEQALGLWRGSPLADIQGSELQRSGAYPLFERWVAVLEDWAVTELRRGWGERAVPALSTAVRADAARENLVSVLMRALHQAGRTGEALEVHRRTADYLRAEFGLDPGQAMREALEAVLRPAIPRNAVGPARPRPVSASAAGGGPVAAGPLMLSTLPRRPGSMTGRTAECAWLDQISRERAVEGSLALVVGPAGVGKTALTVEWAHTVAHRYPGGQLFADLRGFDEESPLTSGKVLAEFLMALGVPDDEVPTAMDERVALYGQLTRDRRLLVVLDNVRSAEDIRDLIPSGAGCATVATSRMALLDLIATEGAACLSLRPLPAADAVALLSALIGPDRVVSEPAAALRLAELCDHLPLALRLAGARLAIRPVWKIHELVADFEDEQDRLDGFEVDGSTGVRAALELTATRLPMVSRRLLALLGLYPGGDIGVASAAALLGSDLAEARTALGVLAAGHILVEEVPGRYTRSSLIRLYSRQLLDGLEHGDRHEAFGRLLDFALAASASAAAPLAVYPWLVERPDGTPPVGVGEWTSGIDAQKWFRAHESTLRYLLCQAAREGRHDLVWRLAENLCMLYLRADPVGHWTATAALGLQSAEEYGSLSAVGRMQSQLGLALSESGRAQEGLAHHETAIRIAEAADDTANLCAGQIRLAVCYERLGMAPALLRQAFGTALRTARRLGDRRVHSVALHHCSRLARADGDASAALRFIDEAIELVADYGDVEKIWLNLNRAWALHELGRAEEASGLARAVLDRTTELGKEEYVAEARTLVERIRRSLDN